MLDKGRRALATQTPAGRTGRLRLAVVWCLLLVPLLMGSTQENAIEVMGGGGKYRFGLCGATLQHHYGQAHARYRRGVAKEVVVEATAGGVEDQYTVVEDDAEAGEDSSVGATGGDTYIFLRGVFRWDPKWVGVAAGGLGLLGKGSPTIFPAAELRLGPRSVNAFVETFMGGFSGGLYEGAFVPVGVLPHQFGGWGVQIDSRFWPETVAKNGVEFRITSRHNLNTIEVGARVHHDGLRFVADVQMRPWANGLMDYAIVLGIGHDLGSL